MELYRAQHYDEAEKLLTEAMQICDGPLKGEHFCVAGVGENLADIARAKGDLPSAERYLKRGADVTQASMGRTAQLGKIEVKLGGVLLHEQKYSQAEAALTFGLQIVMTQGDAITSLAGAMDLSDVYTHTARPAAADKLLHQVLVACPQLGQSCEPLVHAHLGQALVGEGRAELAEAEFRQAAELFGSAGSLDERDASLIAIARIQRDAGRLDQATASFQALVQGLKQRPATSASSLTLTLSQAELAKILAANGRRPEAEALLRSVRDQLETGRLSPGDTAAIRVWVAQADTLLGHSAEAQAMLASAMATPDPPGMQAPAWRAEAESLLGDLSYRAARFEESEAHYLASAAAYAANGSPADRRARLNSAAQVLLEQRRYAEADALLERLLAEAKTQTPTDENGVVNVEANLAMSRNDQGDPKAALAFASDALARYRPPAGRPAMKPAGPLTQLGRAELTLGQYDLAQTHLGAAVAQAEADNTPPDTVWGIQNQLCDAFNLAGKFPEQKACAEKLDAVVKTLSGPVLVRARIASLETDGNVLFNAESPALAAAKYRQALELAQSQPDLPPMVSAGAYMSLGQAYAANSEPLKAREALAKARELFEKAGVGQEEPAAEATRRLGDVEFSLGDLRQAEARTRTALDWFERNRGPTHPRTAAQLRSLGLILMAEGRASEAEPLLQRALDIRQAQSAPNPAFLAQSLADLSVCRLALGRLDSSRELIGKAQAVEADARGKASWYVGVAERMTGELEFAAGRFPEADAAFQRAAPLLAAGGQPALADDLVRRRDVAGLRVQQGRFADARRELESGLASATRAYGPDGLRLIAVLEGLAALDREEGRFEAAETAYHRILALEAKTIGERSPSQITAWLDLAGLKAMTVHFDESQQAIGQAVAIAKESGGLDGPPAVGLLLHIADLEAQIGRLEVARDFAGKALAISRAAPGDSTGLQIDALITAGVAAQRAKAVDQAEPLLAEAVKKAQALWGADSLPTVRPLVELAAVERDKGRFGEAGALLDRAATIGSRALPPAHALNLFILLQLAETRRAAGDVAAAESLAKEALGRLSSSGRPGSPAAGYAQLTLGAIYGSEGLADEAVASILKARALLGGAAPPAP